MTAGPAAYVARGVGPLWWRLVLVAIAGVYFAMLVHPPELHGEARTIAFFAQSTALFPKRDEFSTEFHLEAWSCASGTWVPMDMRPYFPMHADDKESRFQRLAYFYDQQRTVMTALDDYLVRRHAAGDAGDDAVTGPIGGIRLYEVKRAIPELGTTIEHYEFKPLDGVPVGSERSDKFWTKASKRSERCGKTAAAGGTSLAPAPAAAAADGSASETSGGVIHE